MPRCQVSQTRASTTPASQIETDARPCSKLTKLELFKLNDDGDKVQSILTIPVFSTIAAVNAVKLPASSLADLMAVAQH